MWCLEMFGEKQNKLIKVVICIKDGDMFVSGRNKLESSFRGSE